MKEIYIKKRITPAEITSDKVFIMPFNGLGVLAYHVLQQAGVAVQGFFDNNTAISGKRGKIQGEYLPFVTLPPQNRIDENEDICVIVCSPEHNKDINQQLQKLGIAKVIDIKSLLSPDNVKKASQKVCNTMFEGEKISLEKFDLRYLVFSDEIFTPDALILGSLVVCVTERCTLRCVDCSTLMQYYTAPEDIPEKIIKNSFDTLFQTVRRATRINIQGGEPLLYKQLPEIVSHIANASVTEELYIMTNGTLLPSEELLRVMRKTNACLSVNEYGGLSKQTVNIAELCDKSGIRYEIKRDRFWVSMRKFTGVTDANKDDLRKRFHSCESACSVLYRNRFYNCSFTPHAQRLKAIPDDSRDYIDLENGNPPDMRRLLSYLSGNDVIMPSCRFCSGTKFSKDFQVDVAVQCKTPLRFPTVKA